MYGPDWTTRATLARQLQPSSSASVCIMRMPYLEQYCRGDYNKGLYYTLLKAKGPFCRERTGQVLGLEWTKFESQKANVRSPKDNGG